MHKYKMAQFIELFEVPISLTSQPQALALIGEWVREFRAKGQSPKLVVTPNPEMIVAAQSDPEFLKALQSADLAIPDGVGVVWASRLLRPRESGSVSPLALSPYPLALSRVSGIDLMEFLILQPQKVGPFELKVMLLGGRPGIAAQAAENLWRLKRPGLPPEGRAFIKSISGPKNITRASKEEIDDLVNSINQFRPDLLFVAFGHPKQEKWLAANRRRLNAGVAIGVGGALDQIADPSLRPPAYINSIGLGWLYRLLRQPWRWRRQLALVKFAGMVLSARLKIRNPKFKIRNKSQFSKSQ